ncbi:TPA: hypothetical protein DDW35_05420 [Candidatus Sumerlaeota bacterium]|jgi:hypothetical protein|nr:hypothetical protein [Candidatus Sumerlaeota bacterium]
MITRNHNSHMQDELFWRRFAERKQPVPSETSRKTILDAARFAAEKRQAAARGQMAQVAPTPWWFALLSPRAWAAATATALVVFGVWGWQYRAVVATRATTVKSTSTLRFDDDADLLRETDKKLDAIRQSVSGIMQENRAAYVDLTLKTTRHSAGTLRQQTSGTPVAVAEL